MHRAAILDFEVKVGEFLLLSESELQLQGTLQLKFTLKKAEILIPWFILNAP